MRYGPGKHPPDHQGARRPAAELHTRGTPGLLSRIPKDGSENLPSFENAEVCGFEDVVNTTPRVSRPRSSLSSRGTLPTPKTDSFDVLPVISTISNPRGKGGKAGNLAKSLPVDAIHLTGRADTTDGTASGSSRFGRVPRFPLSLPEGPYRHVPSEFPRRPPSCASRDGCRRLSNERGDSGRGCRSLASVAGAGQGCRRD